MTLEEFEKALKGHDWYYEYSDDNRVWRAGTARYEEILKASRQLTEEGHGEAVQKMWLKYDPRRQL
jgi:hypothetical protein